MSQGSWAVSRGWASGSCSSRAALRAATRSGSGTATWAVASHSTTVMTIVLGSARLMDSSPT